MINLVMLDPNQGFGGGGDFGGGFGGFEDIFNTFFGGGGGHADGSKCTKTRCRPSIHDDNFI